MGMVNIEKGAKTMTNPNLVFNVEVLFTLKTPPSLGHEPLRVCYTAV
jgi:hypothetical protein